jgi:hypothetical protein
MINRNKVPFKYIINYKDNDPLHLLYQILDYLESSENQSFSMAEVNLHTTVRDTEDKALPLIEQLETDGYIRKVKSRYEIIKNPW